jgi:hypothetical protein
MSIVRVGTTQKYSEGWEGIFGGKRKKSGTAKATQKAGKGRKKAAARKKK